MTITKDLPNLVDTTINHIQEIKFFIKRYLETKNIQCLKEAREEIKSSKKTISKILKNCDNYEKSREDVEKVFLPLLESIEEIETFLNGIFKDE